MPSSGQILNETTSRSGILSEHEQVSSYSHPKNNFSGFSYRLCKYDNFSPRGKTISNNSKGQFIVGSKFGLYLKPVSVCGHVFSYSPSIKASTFVLQENSTVNKQSFKQSWSKQETLLQSENSTKFSGSSELAMVGRRNASPLLSSSIFRTSRCENSNRLFFPGLGCNYGACQNSRSLGVGKTVVPHKQERTADLFHCSGIFSFPSKRHSCSAVSGQYCCCKLSESRRGDKVTSFVRSRNCNLGVVFTEKDLSFSNPHTRHCKQNPRWSVLSKARKHRMDVRFQCFSSDSGCLSAASSGSLCVSPQPSTPELFFLDPGSTGYGNRCFQHSMEIQSVLPVSSFSSHSEMYSENKTGSDRCIAHNASLEISTMVPSFTRNADGPTSTITPSCQITSSSNVPISSSPINRKENQSSRLACVGKSLKERGISERVSKILLSSWRSSTEKHYQSAWKLFDSWCFGKSEDPISCPVNIVLEFLTDLFDKGLQYRTINTYRSAISMTHLPLDDSLIGSHPLVSRFMKGVFQSRPLCPRYLATWDVSVVLSHLRSLSPKEDLSFKDITFKLTMLMALVGATRADTLHKLDLQFRVFKHDGVSFTIPQLTKTSNPKKPSLKLFFPAFPQDRRLCPVTYLKHYEGLTKEFRPEMSGNKPNPLFLSILSPHKPITSSTLSRWIKCILKDSGIDTSTFKGHSTRSAATSAARNKSVSVMDIMKVADWSNSNTFTKFYYKPIQSSEFGHRVLSN